MYLFFLSENSLNSFYFEFRTRFILGILWDSTCASVYLIKYIATEKKEIKENCLNAFQKPLSDWIVKDLLIFLKCLTFLDKENSPVTEDWFVSLLFSKSDRQYLSGFLKKKIKPLFATLELRTIFSERELKNSKTHVLRFAF